MSVVNQSADGLIMPEGSFSARLRKVPTPLGGLALAIASLGALWAFVLPDFGYLLKLPSAIIAGLMVLAVVLKFVSNPDLFRDDLSHPVLSSVLPTCAMATMMVAQALLSHMPAFAKALWLVAVFAHILLFIGFVLQRVKDFQLQHMVPSWFVPPVGIIVAAVSSTGMGYETLVSVLFTFGLTCYFIKLPVMFYRLIFKEAIPDAALPTFAIMAAPASLSLAGYLTISDRPSYLLIAILLPLAIFMTGLVYIAFIRLLRLPFSPGYASFTFPMVIGSTALYKSADLLGKQGYQKLCDIINQLAGFELLIATVIVVYVAMRYLWFYFSPRHA
ncbi:TDT family transporter [Endozoicomonas ascidiicola]|uniref:TDT family transporter n=1 Tax=Endozoicomonas ascidiicola TaxID=1698521 RepID=UPI000A5ADC00|nr:TDT family transporter [Endozoicomonas ascidiicola]